jgi:hypothetical protein
VLAHLASGGRRADAVSRMHPRGGGTGARTAAATPPNARVGKRQDERVLCMVLLDAVLCCRAAAGRLWMQLCEAVCVTVSALNSGQIFQLHLLARKY